MIQSTLLGRTLLGRAVRDPVMLQSTLLGRAVRDPVMIERPLLGRAVRDPVLLQSTLLGRTLLGRAVQSTLPDGRRGNILGSKSLLSGVNHNGRIVLHRSVDRNHRTHLHQSIYGRLLQSTTIGADLHRSVDLMLQSREAPGPANYK